MATTNEILSEIAAYTAENGRPCPAKHLADKFGTGVIDQIAALKKEGKIYGKRGRTGGLVSNEAAPATDGADATATDAGGDALAAEFAALAAKIAEASAESEQVAATALAWLGLPSQRFDDVLPNLRNFPIKTLGFLAG